MSTPNDGGPAFEYRLTATDGGDAIDVVEDCDGSMIYRANDVVGVGKTLLEAWNDYLFQCHPSAPVNEDELAKMWVDYDANKAAMIERRQRQ